MDKETDTYIMRRAGTFIIVVLVITAGFIFSMPDIKIEMDFKKYMPDDEVVQAFDEMIDYFGEENEYFFILVEGTDSEPNVLSPDSLREQYNISREAYGYEGVIAVYGLAVLMDELIQLEFGRSLSEAGDLTIRIVLDTIKSAMTGKLNLTNYTREEFEALSGILVSSDFDPYAEQLTADNTVILVALDPSLEVPELKILCNNLRNDIEDLPLEKSSLGFTGNYLVSSDIDRIGNQNIIILGFAIVILVTLVLAFTFRKFTYVILPLCTLAIAIIWTLGSMALLGLSFTIIDVAVIPLILGLGVDYTVHNSRRYFFELESNSYPPDAMNVAQRRIVPPIFLAVLTTTIAFMSNQLSTIKPVREFGLVCAIGIFYAFVLTLIFHNTSRVIIDMIFNKNEEEDDGKAHEDTRVVKVAIRTATKSVTWYPVLVITIVAMVTLLAFAGAVNVRTEFSERDFLPEEWDSIKTSKKLNDRFEAGRYSEVFVFIRDEYKIPQNIATVQMLNRLQEFEDEMRDDRYIVTVAGEPQTISILFFVQKALAINSSMALMYDSDNDLIPDDNDAVKAVYDFLMEYDAVADPLTGETFSERIAKFLHRDQDGQYDAIKISILVRAETTDEIQEMYDDLKKDIPDFPGTVVVITGNMIMTIVTIDALQSSQIDSTILAVILAFILLVILYRSFGLGLLSLIPVVLSTLWILGTMFLFGISLNMLTVMVTALTIGLGLDYAIYIVARYKEERKLRNVDEAIDVTIKGTGSALFISGITTVCGFIVLIISPIPIIRHFGLIIAMTIIYCGGLAVIVLPILLKFWEKIKTGKDKI